jgi:hypothetical protein
MYSGKTTLSITLATNPPIIISILATKSRTVYVGGKCHISVYIFPPECSTFSNTLWAIAGRRPLYDSLPYVRLVASTVSTTLPAHGNGPLASTRSHPFDHRSDSQMKERESHPILAKTLPIHQRQAGRSFESNSMRMDAERRIMHWRTKAETQRHQGRKMEAP